MYLLLVIGLQHGFSWQGLMTSIVDSEIGYKLDKPTSVNFKPTESQQLEDNFVEGIANMGIVNLPNLPQL